MGAPGKRVVRPGVVALGQSQTTDSHFSGLGSHFPFQEHGVPVRVSPPTGATASMPRGGGRVADAFFGEEQTNNTSWYAFIQPKAFGASWEHSSDDTVEDSSSSSGQTLASFLKAPGPRGTLPRHLHGLPRLLILLTFTEVLWGGPCIGS